MALVLLGKRESKAVLPLMTGKALCQMLSAIIGFSSWTDSVKHRWRSSFRINRQVSCYLFYGWPVYAFRKSVFPVKRFTALSLSVTSCECSVYLLCADAWNTFRIGGWRKPVSTQAASPAISVTGDAGFYGFGFAARVFANSRAAYKKHSWCLKI